MRLLIVGLGSVGRRHLRNLLTLGVEDVILLRSGHSTLPEEELATRRQVNTLEAALALEPEAAVIATPSALHLASAIPLAQAGCHLLIEKPVSHTLEGVETLAQACKASGTRVLVGFQYRFHPGLQQVAAWIQQGEIGEVVAAQAIYAEHLPGWHPWEDYRQSYAARPDLGGGAVLTLCHPLDYLQWILGEVVSVSAQVTRSAALGLQVEDVADISLRFRSGALGCVHLDYHRRPPLHRLELTGTGGSVAWDQGAAPTLWRAGGKEKLTAPLPAGFERNAMFLAEMSNFLDVVKGEASPACSLEEGMLALGMALGALQSAAAGRVVELPEVTPDPKAEDA